MGRTNAGGSTAKSTASGPGGIPGPALVLALDDKETSRTSTERVVQRMYRAGPVSEIVGDGETGPHPKEGALVDSSSAYRLIV